MLAALAGAGATLAIELLALAFGAVVVLRVWRRMVGGPVLEGKERRMFGPLNLTSIGIRLLGALAVVAAIYAIGHSAGTRAEQRREDKAISPICEAVGAAWVEVDGDGKPLPRRKWGSDCLKAARGLAKFKADAMTASAKVVADHETDEARKTAADVEVARRTADAVAAARKRMETANAKVKDDRVDGGWFAGLNELGGLRGPAPGSTHRPLSNPSDAPPY